VDVPELERLVENVVLPHPCIVAGASEAANVNVGRRTVMESLVSKGEFKANMNQRGDGALTIGFESTNFVCTNAEVGAMIPGEATTEPATAAISVADPNFTATVRVFRFAACTCALVVTPVATVTVHSDPAASVAVFALSVSVAVDVPE
jgi:hypothetical protein